MTANIDHRLSTKSLPARVGSVVSRLRPTRGSGLPPYVTLVEETNLLSVRTLPTWIRRTNRCACAGRDWATALARGLTLDHWKIAKVY